MPEEEINVEGLDLSDAELITVLKNHGLSRRVLMKAVGVGAGAAMLSGTAAGQEGRGNRIHDVFGAPYAADENVPSGLVDYVVDLDILPGEAGQHAGFPDPDDETPEFVFEPVGLHVEPGSVVNFRNVSVEHTATAFHEKWSNPEVEFPTRVPDGVPGFTSPPYVADESWLYRFTTKGVYDLLCFPHLGLGMVMRIVVFDPDEDCQSEDRFDGWGPFAENAEPGEPFFNPNRVLTDDELDPRNIIREGEIAWADLDLETEEEED